MDRETIERCAEVCDEYAEEHHERGAIVARYLAAKIRALPTALPCGHPLTAIAGDGPTHWCAMCEAEAGDEDANTEAMLDWAGAW